MDNIDKKIINHLQQGFPVSARPYQQAAMSLGLTEQELITRLERMLTNKLLTRFGPLYNIEKLGGAYSLVAMQVADKDLDKVAAIVNQFTEVAHNYQRQHQFNLWFVIAACSRQRILDVNRMIEQKTAYKTYNMPKLAEYFVALHFNLQ